MELKLKKTEPDYHATSAYLIIVDGEERGFLQREETTKTGFRRGYCVGQVPCFGWFFMLDGKHYGSREFGSGPKYRTKKAATEAITALLEGASDG